jgi:hypothetical protein
VRIDIADGDNARSSLEATVDRFLHVGLALAADADATEKHGVARRRPAEHR